MGHRNPEFFESCFQHPPQVMAQGPGRVNLIGEHTDYNQGWALPFAIEQSVTVALSPRDDRRVRVASAEIPGVIGTDLDRLRSAEGWAAYPLGAAWALLQEVGADSARGFDLALTSEVPIGAGLSSSAALETAVLVGLCRLWDLEVDRRTLARLGQRAENEVVGAPTGIMDQMASLLGTADAAVLLDCRDLSTELVDLSLEAAGLQIVVIDTRMHHSHAGRGYRTRREECVQATRLLGLDSLRDLDIVDIEAATRRLDERLARRVRHVVTENQRVLDTVSTLRSEGPAAIGKLLNASHDSLRNDFEVSCPEVDLAVELARTMGALGARMTGGGFGGSAIALLRPDVLPGLTEEIEDVYARCFYDIPQLFVATPAPGAGLLP